MVPSVSAGKTWISAILVLYLIQESTQFHLLDDFYDVVTRVKRQGDAPCRNNQFKCKSGECIPKYEKCDGIANCVDSSDETVACREEDCRPPNFRCSYGACIAGSSKCDGVKDCVDNSDENNNECRQKVAVTDGNCKNSQFKCNNGQCIPRYEKCDGEVNCDDESDETEEHCKNENCRNLGFRCKYGACLSESVRCNGVNDCVDKSDEEPTMCGYATERTPTVTPTTATIPPPNTAGKCLTPPYPEWGKYSIDTGRGEPGSYVDSRSIITFSCFKNYRLVPQTPVIPCLNGKWSYPIPECVSTCPERKSSTVDFVCRLNGNIVDCTKRLLEGTVAEMKCKSFHEEKERSNSGPRKQICKSGTWDVPPLYCEPGQDNIVLKFNVNYKIYLSRGDLWDILSKRHQADSNAFNQLFKGISKDPLHHVTIDADNDINEVLDNIPIDFYNKLANTYSNLSHNGTTYNPNNVTNAPTEVENTLPNQHVDNDINEVLHNVPKDFYNKLYNTSNSLSPNGTTYNPNNVTNIPTEENTLPNQLPNNISQPIPIETDNEIANNIPVTDDPKIIVTSSDESTANSVDPYLSTVDPNLSMDIDMRFGSKYKNLEKYEKYYKELYSSQTSTEDSEEVINEISYE